LLIKKLNSAQKARGREKKKKKSKGPHISLLCPINILLKSTRYSAGQSLRRRGKLKLGEEKKKKNGDEEKR